MTKFEVKTLSIVISIAAVTLLGIALVKANGPVQWDIYKKDTFQRALKNKRTVLIFLNAGWDAHADLIKNLVSNTPSVKQAIRSQHILALKTGTTLDRPHDAFKKWTESRSSTFILFKGDNVDVLAIPPLNENTAVDKLLKFLGEPSDSGSE